jgi:hypothetical protein
MDQSSQVNRFTNQHAHEHGKTSDPSVMSVYRIEMPDQ